MNRNPGSASPASTGESMTPTPHGPIDTRSGPRTAKAEAGTGSDTERHAPLRPATKTSEHEPTDPEPHINPPSSHQTTQAEAHTSSDTDRHAPLRSDTENSGAQPTGPDKATTAPLNKTARKNVSARRATPAAGRVPAERGGGQRLAVERLPLLVAGGLALLVGLWGGLGRLEVGPAVPREAFAAQHGPLMVLGFLGTLIALERAVAVRRGWAYAAPALGGAGAVALAAGFAQVGRWALTVAAGWLIAVYVVVVLERRPGREIIVQMTGAIAWYVGGLLWIRGAPVADLVPWMMAFLVLTIAGERLELAHVAFLRRRAGDGLMAAAGLLVAGVLISVPLPGAGWRITGMGMLTLAVWLGAYDIARRTVRGTGLPRFAAVCLLGGYVWLAVAGVLWLVAGRADGELYDAALHAVFLGFVMSMVFGHAPVILPAVLRVPLPYRPVLYAPLALLHLSLLVRVAGDLAGVGVARAVGGVLGEVSLVAFVICAAASAVLAQRRGPRSRGARSGEPRSRAMESS